MFICIGPCPLVFLARIPSLAATTVCLMWLAKQIVKLLSSKHRILRVSLASALLLLSALASIGVNHILFSLIVNLIGGGGICTGLVHASFIEISVPSLGTIFVLTKARNRRITKYIHVLFKFLFFAAISFGLYYSILGNLILYDAWGLNLDWPYHGDYETYLKFEQRLKIFGTSVLIYCSIIFSILFNRLVRYFAPTAPIGKLSWFILGLFIAWLLPFFCYSQIYESLASYGFVFWFSPGLFARLIAPLIFILTWIFVNKIKVSKIKVVKNKTKFNLEQIKIASPCPASWEEMSGDDKVRFCQICSKNVYNLSSMTRDEAQMLIMDQQGKLCGLLYLRKDGSVMTADCPIGFGEMRRRVVKKIAKVAAAAFALIGLQQFFIGDRAPRHENFDTKTNNMDEDKLHELKSLGYITD
jgi:hypothetical protein